MNREEAITALGDRNILLWGMSWEEQKYYSKALDMAISALKERKGKGKWIDSSNGWTCSICNRDSKSDTAFCPHCGVKMKGVRK